MMKLFDYIGLLLIFVAFIVNIEYAKSEWIQNLAIFDFGIGLIGLEASLTIGQMLLFSGLVFLGLLFTDSYDYDPVAAWNKYRMASWLLLILAICLLVFLLNDPLS